MATRAEWRCNNCGHIVNTSGPWELYSNTAVKRRIYWHRRPVSEDANNPGIKGYFVKWYCPHCREVVDSVEIESKEHINYWEQWNQPEVGLLTIAFCPSCGAGLKERLDDNEICPKCNRGKFELSNRWWL